MFITNVEFRHVARNLQWVGGCFGRLGAEPPALKYLLYFFFQNLINFKAYLDKNYCF